MSRLLKLHRAIGQLAHDTPDILQLPEVLRALENEFVHVVVRCLADAVDASWRALRSLESSLPRWRSGVWSTSSISLQYRGHRGVQPDLDPISAVLGAGGQQHRLEKSYREVNANRRDECDVNRDGSVSDDMAPVHKSSRMPLKNGCRTLPSALLRPVLDFSQQLGLHPNPLVGDPLHVGLRVADQRCQALP
jgi:hypothetical protein